MLRSLNLIAPLQTVYTSLVKEPESVAWKPEALLHNTPLGFLLIQTDLIQQFSG
jgi:hypothetical protein